MKKCEVKGTITVFLSLLSVLFLTLICTLTESARVQGARAKAAASMDMGLYSLLGEYERKLMEGFGVMALDGGYGSGTLNREILKEKLGEYIRWNAQGDNGGGFDFFRLQVEEVGLDGYILLTDQGGEVFRAQVIGNWKENPITQLSHQYLADREEAQRQENQGENCERESAAAEAGLGALESQKESEVQKSENQGEEETAVEEKMENPLEVIKKVRKMGILALVVRDTGGLSVNTVDKGRLPSGRSLNTGTLEAEPGEGGVMDEIIFENYLFQHFGSYGSPKETNHLRYEMEYILAGKDSDLENLKSVVNRLLIMREGANFLCIQTDPVLGQQLKAFALALATSLGVPQGAELVEAALELAWAYGESLMDVRTLLAGGKVPVAKNKESWKLSIENLVKLTEVLEECDSGQGQGQSYEEYLRLLFMVGKRRAYPMRALDLMELEMRSMEGRQGFRADNCLVQVKGKGRYRIPPVLLSGSKTLSFGVEGRYSY